MHPQKLASTKRPAALPLRIRRNVRDATNLFYLPAHGRTNNAVCSSLFNLCLCAIIGRLFSVSVFFFRFKTKGKEITYNKMTEKIA